MINNSFPFFGMGMNENDGMGDPILQTPFAGEIIKHFEASFGKSSYVIHENTKEVVHVDVNVIPPSKHCEMYILYTTGMSSKHMTVPPGYDQQKFGELMICLPPDWPMSRDEFGQNLRDFLPVYWLKKFARYPHENNTWLAPWHTVDNEEPYSKETDLSCMFFAPLAIMGCNDELSKLETSDGQVITFSLLMPIYKSEMEFKLKNGPNALVERLVRRKVSYILDLNRDNVCE